MKPYIPQKIYIEKAARHFAIADGILKNLPGVPVEEIEDCRLLIRSIGKKFDPIGEGKRALVLAYDKGQSFKPFPESADYVSCDYFTLHIAEGCNLECSYCILQAYLTNPFLTVYVNLEETLEKLECLLRQNPGRLFRVGTGQLADSLSLDHLTGFSEILVPFFARQENAVLELKTKSTNIGRLLSLSPSGKTIVSWSLNSKKIQREEEHKCATIEERIAAARKISEVPGYRVGFHFDPVIDYPGWEEDYREVVDELFSQIPQGQIAWISLGCLRFMPRLKSIMQARFPRSRLASSEWIIGMDGKMRYLKSRRLEIYKRMTAFIRRHTPSLTLYLCMESSEVWQHVFGEEISKEKICSLLDRAASKKGGGAF